MRIRMLVDLAFSPNAAPPRLIGKLKKFYPHTARSENIQARVFVKILIDTEGNVLDIEVQKIILSKKLPSGKKLS